MAFAVEIQGLREFRRALRQIDPKLTVGITVALRDAAQIVATAARRRAPKRSGRMAVSTRPYARGLEAGVRTTATRVSPAYPAGYPYPKRIEFENGGARAFLAPALEENQDRVARRMEFLLSDIEDVWSG